MAGFIGTWGPRQEALHPRGFHGRFIRKFNIPEILPRILKMMDAAFHPRSFGSQGQAGQYLFNQGKPGRFGNGADYRRLHFDFDEANAHLQQGDIDPTTQRYIDMMERNATTLPDDIITAQSFTPESLGMTPEQMNEPGGDFNGLIGAVIADRGYSAVHVGQSPNHGPGKVLLTIATPKGTKVIIPGRSRNDSGLFLDRDQDLLVTSVSQDGRGGWYMMAVAMPKSDKDKIDVPNLAAPRGAGLTPQQREERIGAPQAPDLRAQRAGTPPPLGAGGQVTEQNVGAPDQPSPPAPAPAQAPSAPAAPPSPTGRGVPPPRNEPVHRDAVGGTGGADGKTAEEIAQTPAEPAPGSSPESVAAPAPQAVPNEHVEKARQRAQVKREYRKFATSVPVADAMQEIEELTHKKQDNKVIAQHIRGIISDPSMEEVPKDERDRMTQRLTEAADLFEAGKVNQGRQRLASMGRELDLVAGDKPGSTVDYDPATMDSVSDVPDGSQVEIIRPSIIHTDPDTGKETVVSKGRVRPVGGAAPETGAPDRQGGTAPEAGPTTVEAPAAPAPVKKAGGMTPNEERVVERAKLWRGHERNSEEERIVAQADAILAREGKGPAAPAPERVPRTGRAPMAKKAAAKAAPGPAKKAEPKKLPSERKPYTHTAAGILKEADEELANGRDPGQVAEEMRDKAEALLEHGEPLQTDDLVNRGRLEHSDEDLRDIARADSSLIHRMADDLEKESAPSPPAKKAPAKKAVAKKAPDLLAEREAKKLELAKRQGERERIAREKAAERARVAEEKKAAAAKAKEERAAAKAAAPAKKAVKKAAPAKDLTPEQQKAAEVQARADEAGLPAGVTALRAMAKEQGIRGFSTMRKEQLQRALLGEEVSTGTTKLQVVSPEKMIGHLERVETNSDAEKLLEKHTLKDLKELADRLEIDYKGRKLTTKNKLKSAILEKVRGAPGTDFEPIPPDQAISIRDVQIPDGEMGDMLRRGLVEVDENDPESLRDESERLESHATQLRQRGDKVNAALYQEASDRMGMRAQQISGMEEVPKPVKRAPRKAATEPALGEEQFDRLFAEGDLDALSKELDKPRLVKELQAIAERQGVTRPTRFRTKTALKAEMMRLARHIRNPEPEAPETPNPLLATPEEVAADAARAAERAASVPVKKVARKAAPEVLPTGPRQPGTTPLGLEPGPASDRIERIAKQRSRGTAFAHIHQVAADGGSDRAIESVINSNAKRYGLSDGEKNALLKAHSEGRLQAEIERLAGVWGLEQMHVTGDTIAYDPANHRSIGGDLRNNTPVTVIRPGYRDTRHGEGVIVSPDIQKASKEDADKFRAAQTRARKVVAPGSTPGSRAQARMTNQQRADAFRAAWDAAGIRDDAGRSASRSMAEIRERVYHGELTPEEGIRRLETDIDFNKMDVAEIEAVLRDEQLDPAERKDLTSKLGNLHADIAEQEKASKFMRQYFRKEPEVTPAEAKAALDPEQQSWLANASPDEIREGARLQGLGEIKGDTAEEVWDNAVRAVVEREIASREAKKAKAAKAAAKKALPPAAPKVDPEDPERLDVRRIGHGLDLREEDGPTLNAIQKRLDAGEDPATVGRNLESSALSPRAQRNMVVDLTDMDARIKDAREQGMPPEYIRGLEAEQVRLRAAHAQLTRQASVQEELGRRLQAMKRPARAKGARRVGPWDPLPIFMENGEGGLRERLSTLDLEQLRDIIAEGGMDPGRTLGRTTDRKRLEDWIVRRVSDRSTKGRAFRAPPTPEHRTPAKAAPAAPGMEGRVRPGGQIPLGKIEPGDRVYVEKTANGAWRPTTRKTGSTILTVTGRAPAASERGFRRTTNRQGLVGTDENGNEIRVMGHDGRGYPGHQTFKAVTDTPEVAAAKKETADVRARLLTTAMERLEGAKTEAQVREALQGLTLPELKTVAGKYPVQGKTKAAITQNLVDFFTAPAKFEPLTRGGRRDAPIPAGRFSDKPKIPNKWGDVGGEVAFHDDGPIGQALLGLGQEAKLDVDGDTLENVVGRLATRSVRGDISSEQMITDLKRLDARLPEGRAKQQLARAIAEIDTPKRDPLSLPPGTPAPMVELMEMLSGIPLAREAPRGKRMSAMEELQKIAQELANGERLRGGPDTAMEQRIYNTIHESYGAEGKFEIDRAVRRAIEEMRQARRRPG